MGIGMGGFGGLGMLLFWGLLALAVFVLVRGIVGDREPRGAASTDPALRTLEQRYALGELDRDEFERKRKDLTL